MEEGEMSDDGTRWHAPAESMLAKRDGYGKRPTHTLKACKMDEKGRKRHNAVGIAWLNKDGSMSIALHVGVTLSWNDGITLTAFPDTRPERAERKPVAERESVAREPYVGHWPPLERDEEPEPEPERSDPESELAELKRLNAEKAEGLNPNS